MVTMLDVVDTIILSLSTSFFLSPPVSVPEDHRWHLKLKVTAPVRWPLSLWALGASPTPRSGLGVEMRPSWCNPGALH